MKRINAGDAKYAPTEAQPSRILNAWRDVAEGDEFYLPYGAADQWKLLPGMPLRVDKRHVRIRGDGSHGYGIFSANRDEDAIIIEVSDVHIHDLMIGRFFWREGEDFAANGPTLGKGSGIACYRPEPVGGVRLERVTIEYMGLAGIHFGGTGENGYQVCPTLRDVMIYGCGSDGLHGRMVNGAEAHVRASQCGGIGVMLVESAGGHWHVTTESNRGPHQIALSSCDSIAMRVWVEDFAGREGVLLASSKACRVGGRFGAWGAAVSVRFRTGAVGNTLEASQHFGHPVPPQVTDGGDASVRDNIICKQPGASVTVNARRNRLL